MKSFKSLPLTDGFVLLLLALVSLAPFVFAQTVRVLSVFSLGGYVWHGHDAFLRRDRLLLHAEQG